MPLSTNKDIWTEILEYFRVSLSRDNADEIKEKRRIILSIALCVQCSLFFEGPRISGWGFLLDRPSGKDHDGPQVATHLLSVSHQISPSFWEHLPQGVLAVAIPLYQAYHLTALASSSLQSINFQAGDSSSAVASSIILDTLNYRGIRMLDIIYTDYITKNVLSRIFQFSELRSLTLKTTQYRGSHLESSDIQSFGTLAHLTTLNLSLGMFQMASDVGRWIESMAQLSVLSLLGRWPSVYGCIQNRTFVAVQSLSVILQPCYSSRRRRLSTVSNWSTVTNSGNLLTIVKAFPSLHSLSLENEANENTNEIIISRADIPKAPKESPLRCLELRNMKLALDEADIINIMRAWPSLESLSIIPSANKRLSYSASEILAYASHGARCLREMNLPLDLSSLTSTSYSISIRSSGKCPLRRLELPWVRNLPQDLKGTLMLARNLVALFPKLHDVTLLDLESDIRDLRTIIEFLRDTISSPPHRSDDGV
ncbi:hypothetical protein Agabi119p4_6000 [Agaricus bisporus var. burnettii]|uniref:Uncharacterized protein n=1 Tax=Agaricus bisporus var. burnettii TaxID=192524 RepID=A0A8H7KG48_AGABI|nr:hypothetical protein Agabi119p4_6000 [Agaricus bisporus var. burnettii]